MKDIITITGDVGSGKSTSAKLLAASLGYRHISTGTIQREIAARRGITTLQLNEASMKNREVDDDIDAYVQRLGMEEKHLILDSRMAWHFVPASFKVFVTVDPYIGARRVLDDRRNEEVHSDVADAMRNNLRRKELEDMRFARLYGVCCDALENFDLVADSTWVTPECVATVIGDAFQGNNVKLTQAYICPRSLYPTRSISEAAKTHISEIFESMKVKGYDAEYPVEAVHFHNYFFIFDGHKRISCALRLGLNHVPCVLREKEADSGIEGLTFQDEVISSLGRPLIHDWENAHGLKYPSYPDANGNPILEF